MNNTSQQLPTGISEDIAQQLRRWRSLIPAPVFVIHAIVFLLLVAWSWRKWNEPVIDFGRELYVPWQLTRGKVLYRDISSLFGPLSPYINALWMRLFGVSLITIAMCNAAIFAGVIAAVHYFIRGATDRFTATAASLAAIALCGFCQYRSVGNYNFITPYAHEATHGFALGVLTLVFAHRAMATARTLPAALSGLCFGLSLLTKTEVPVATAVALAVGWFGHIVLDNGLRTTLRIATAFCAGCVAGPALFFMYFRQYEPTPTAIRDVAGAWIAVLNPAVTMNVLYRMVSGMDQPVRNLVSMALWFAAVVAGVATAVVLMSMTPPRRSRASEVRHVCLVAMLAAAPLTQFLPLGTALPLVTLAALVAISRAFWNGRHDREIARRQLALMMWCAFATALLAKMALRVGIYAYGFYLALPAVTVAIICLCSIIPDALENWRPGRLARDFRLFAAVAIAASVIPNLGVSNRLYAAKNAAIGEGGDRFYVSSDPNAPGALQALEFRDAVTWLRHSLKPGESVTVVPEGVMLNYLLRVESPLRVVTLMPPEILTFGESTIADSLQASPPTYVVYVHKGTDEYGYRLFGTTPDYGERTMTWIRAHYDVVRTFGHEPLSGNGDGIQIFQLHSGL